MPSATLSCTPGNLIDVLLDYLGGYYFFLKIIFGFLENPKFFN